MTEPYLGHDLIFIVSLPRSGSTLLQRVLAGHPEVGASSEPWLLLHPAYGRRSTGILTEYDADWAALAVNEFLQNYTEGASAYDDGVRAFAEVIYRNAMQRAGATRFIDKTPRYVMILDELLRWFPEARFVFLLRHPLSALASIVNTQVNHDLTALERFRNELLRGPAALIAGMQALGKRASVVRYEEFVAAPEAATRALCAELELEFRADMLEYSTTAALQGRMQDRTGINQHTRPVTGREAGWRQMLNDPQQLEFAQGYLRELGAKVFEQLGYDFDEANEAVREAAQRHPRVGYVYPWEVALLTPQQKRGRDQLHVDRYYAYRQHGVWTARLLVAKAWWGGVLAAIRYARRHGNRNFAVREDLGPR
ncbi:MAG: sulfotransferase [Gammaproteobacteria bacterium]|nr:sulfotransferase [Gammaproteobacteria bacterium]